MLVGQALASANLCAECGEALVYSVKTGLPCEPRSLEGHYHEKRAVHGNGSVPWCCKCLRASGAACQQLENKEEDNGNASASTEGSEAAEPS